MPKNAAFPAADSTRIAAPGWLGVSAVAVASSAAKGLMFSKSLLVPPICVPGGPPAPELPAAPPPLAPLAEPVRLDAGVAPGLPEVEAASLQVDSELLSVQLVDHKTSSDRCM